MKTISRYDTLLAIRDDCNTLALQFAQNAGWDTKKTCQMWILQKDNSRIHYWWVCAAHAMEFLCGHSIQDVLDEIEELEEGLSVDDKMYKP